MNSVKTTLGIYAQYVKDREGFEWFETDDGFATFKINSDECYIRDIYIKPERRKLGLASAIADHISEVAKNNGCKWLVGSVCPAAKNSHAALLVLIGYGMKLVKSEDNLVYMSKRIN